MNCFLICKHFPHLWKWTVFNTEQQPEEEEEGVQLLGSYSRSDQHPLFSLPSCFFLMRAFAFGACIIFEDYTAEILLLLYIGTLFCRRRWKQRRRGGGKGKLTTQFARQEIALVLIILYTFPTRSISSINVFTLGATGLSSSSSSSSLFIMIRRGTPGGAPGARCICWLSNNAVIT